MIGHSDWLDTGWQYLLDPKLRGGETGKSGTPSPQYRDELPTDLAGFLDSTQAELSRDIPSTLQLCNCYALQQIQDKLLQAVYFIIMWHIH
jgi:hypothetical protein